MRKNIFTGLILSLLAAGLSIACAQPAVLSLNNSLKTAEPLHNLEAANQANPSACDNVFYPLAVNNQWTYLLDSFYKDREGQAFHTQPSTLSLTVKNVADSFAMISIANSASGIETQSPVVCRDGAIVDYPMTELNMLSGMLAGDLALQYQSGVFMPSQKDFEDHNWDMGWETEYTANGTLEGLYEGETLTADLASSPVRIKWKIIGTSQPLEVPAGKFDDLVKVNRKISFDVSNLHTNIENSEIDIATTLTLDTDLWYAPGVGLVKQQINAAFVKFYGINFPIDVKGAIELQSYIVH